MRTVTIAAVIAVVGAMFFSLPTQALSWGDYLRFRGDPMADALLMTMGQSYMFADFEMRDAGAGPLYCQPENLTVNGSQYRSILDGYVERFPPSDSEAPVELLMLYALKYTFPC